MLRGLVRAVFKLGLLGALVAVVMKVLQRRSQPGASTAPEAWPRIDLDDNQPVASEPVAVAAPWVEPVGITCPASHPVKAKMASGVFHLPGMMHYDRTKPDRCYIDPAAAEADGLRQAKR